MSNAEKKTKKSDGKRQTSVLIGIAMMILAAVFVYFAVSQPGVNRNTETAPGGDYSQQTESPEIPSTEDFITEDLQATENAETENTPQTNKNPQMSNAPQTSKAPQTSNVPQTSSAPTQAQTAAPTQATTQAPTEAPTKAPTQAQTAAPTQAPTAAPTESPTNAPTPPSVSVQYPLNLNTCTAEELMTLDGIGEVRAASIIAYREYLGGYTDVEQLKNISGIGDGIFAKIEPYVTV